MNIKGYFLMLMLCGVMHAAEPQLPVRSQSFYSEQYAYNGVQSLKDLAARKVVAGVRSSRQFANLALPVSVQELCARHLIGNFQGTDIIQDAPLLAYHYCARDNALNAFAFAVTFYRAELQPLKEIISDTSGYPDPWYEEQLQKKRAEGIAQLGKWQCVFQLPGGLLLSGNMLADEVVDVLQDWLVSGGSLIDTAIESEKRRAVDFFLTLGQRPTKDSLNLSLARGEISLAKNLLRAGVPKTASHFLIDHPVWQVLMKHVLPDGVKKEMLELLINAGFSCRDRFPLYYGNMHPSNKTTTLITELRTQAKNAVDNQTKERATRALALLEPFIQKSQRAHSRVNEREAKRRKVEDNT